MSPHDTLQFLQKLLFHSLGLNEIAKDYNGGHIPYLPDCRVYLVKDHRPSQKEQNRIDNLQRNPYREEFPCIDHPEAQHKQIGKYRREYDSPNAQYTNEEIIHNDIEEETEENYLDENKEIDDDETEDDLKDLVVIDENELEDEL